MSSTFFILGKACHRRREEIAMVREFLLANGRSEEWLLGRADLVLYFACAGVRHIVDASVKEIRQIQEMMKPGAELVVGSCLPAMDKASLRQVFEGRTITPTDFSPLNGLADIQVPIESMPKMWGSDAVCPPLPRPSPTVALKMLFDDAALETLKFAMRSGTADFLKPTLIRLQRRHTVGFSVAAGCSKRCTYCARPFASGKVRSKPIDVVLGHIRHGLRIGYRRFDLCADSIGVYGADLGVNLGDLLHRIADVEDRLSVGLYDVHPQDFIRFFGPIRRLLQSGKLHYIYVGVQSGNDRILRLMRRPCNLADLTAKLAEVRRCPHVFMQSGVIVGFPGETEPEFQDTLQMLKCINFDDVYVHCYCDLPNTESAALPGKLDKETLRRRLDQIKLAGIHYDAVEAQHEWESNLLLAGIGRTAVLQTSSDARMLTP